MRPVGMAFGANNSNRTLQSQVWEIQRGKLERISQRLLVSRNLKNAHQLLAAREFFPAIGKEPSDADVARYHRDPFDTACFRLPDNLSRKTESKAGMFSTLSVAGGRGRMHALVGYSAQAHAISYPTMSTSTKPN